MRPHLAAAWLLSVLILFCSASQAATDPPQLLDRLVGILSEPAVVRAEFIQEKRMAVLTRPLISRGRITVSRRDGVIWQLEAPIRMSVAFGETKIIEVDAEGRRRVRGIGENRAQAEVGRIFKELLAADMASLRRYFQVDAEGDLESWRIRLTPRSPEVARFIKTMQLTGGRHIEVIRIEEAGGDATSIRLRNIESTTTLNQAEQALFADS